MIRSGAQILWECLVREGVDIVFGYPGGAILPAYDAMLEYPIRHVLVRHEQGAAHMADGYARASGRVGVAVATSGPGATNLTTGIATAMMDSIPTVFITGQVPSKVLGTDAFQETDVTGITLPITKHNALVTDVREHRAHAARGLRASRAAGGPARCWWTSARTRSRRRPSSCGRRTSTLPGDRTPAPRCAARTWPGAGADRRAPSARSSWPATASCAPAPRPPCGPSPRRRTSRWPSPCWASAASRPAIRSAWA